VTRSALFAIVLLIAAGGNPEIESATRMQDGVRWYASSLELNERNQSLTLGPGRHDLVLRTDILCRISDVSVMGTRIVSCDLGSRAVEFSVECLQRTEDRTQIRFRAADGKAIDYIEVGCRRPAR
jgi:hypothetical protein